jgi:hypothetical protein
MRAGKEIEEENMGFFCSATKFALKEEKNRCATFHEMEVLAIELIKAHPKDKRPKTKLQILMKKLVEEGNQEKSGVLTHKNTWTPTSRRTSAVWYCKEDG